LDKHKKNISQLSRSWLNWSQNLIGVILYKCGQSYAYG